MAAIVPNVTLSNGVEMPVLGFGVYQIPPEDTEQAAATALEVGYRLIDTAASYQNEEEVGRAVRTSGIPRDEVFITTKLWIQDPGEANARAAFERSLERLGLDHVDLYLIHQPLGDYYSSWRAMEQINAEGLARAIGVANFYPDRLVDLIEHNDIAPAVNQIEVNPFFQRHADQELAGTHGVQIEAWGGFAEGKNNLFTDPLLAEIGDVTARASPRSCSAGSSNATSSRSRSRFGVSAWNRTSLSSTSPSPTKTWPGSPAWTPAPRSSSTTTIPQWSAGSTAARAFDASTTRQRRGVNRRDLASRPRDCPSSHPWPCRLLVSAHLLTATTA